VDSIYVSAGSDTSNLTGTLTNDTLSGLGMTGTYPSMRRPTGGPSWRSSWVGERRLPVKGDNNNIVAIVYGGLGDDVMNVGNDANQLNGITASSLSSARTGRTP